MKADPQTVAFNQQIEAMLNAGAAWHEMGAQELRDYLVANPLGPPPAQLESAQARTVTGPHGDVPIRVFVPQAVEGVYLHLHGGGWVIGSHEAQDERLMARANATRQAVVSVGYRMAPENPYPAPNDDCEAAAKWLTASAQSEFGTSKLTIGGESAGAHLAVTTLLRMRDRHGYAGFRGAALQYGVYDCRLTPSARTWGSRRLILTTALMDWFVDHYAAGCDLTNPDISPIYANLKDMPPAIFSVGTADPLLDDTLILSQRWAAAGNEHQLDIYPAACHGFDGFPIPAGMEATARVNSFLSRALAD
jgi:acetyl esterase/lipase